ncbi:MAG TPA: hypothetical protein VM186_03735 [Planctomycetota bacterium]|nr:hypothetical protein [Planctomycetota bacterium]
MYGKLAAPSWQAALLSPLISLLGGWVHIAWQSRATAADVHAGLPFCEKHAPYWARRSFIIVGGWLLAAALVLLCVAFSFLPAMGDVIMGVTALYVVLFLPTFILIHLTSMRPTYSDDASVTISGVSAAFVKAVDAMRQGQEKGGKGV